MCKLKILLVLPNTEKLIISMERILELLWSLIADFSKLVSKESVRKDLPTCCLHDAYMFPTCCLHAAYMLPRCCLHAAYML